jgi:succinylglutamate desuccinylase
VIGNPEAIAAGTRFIDTDMNRLFGARAGASGSGFDAQRADEIMRAVTGFFSQVDADVKKWHFDLHTTIRPSHYPTFAVVPDTLSPARKHALLGWLGQAGIGAVIFNPRPAGTFSACTSATWDAASATVELGQVGAMGDNDLGRFAAARDALDTFIRRGSISRGAKLPHIFSVVRVLVRHSDAFRMTFDRSVRNFTPMAPDTVIATDGDIVYRVGSQTEYVVFPNPDVQIGLRAGLMVARDTGVATSS